MGITGTFSEENMFNIDEEDYKYIYDKEVIDCEFKLYMLLLVEDKDLQDKLYNEFETLYLNLTEEKKEYIKSKLYKIFQEQDKNNKEKEKKLWEKQ